MNKKLYFLIFILVTIFLSGCSIVNKNTQENNFVEKTNVSDDESKSSYETMKEAEKLHPMAIEGLRSREYPGGSFEIERKLANGINYQQYVVSYLSEGLKIYGLLTVPLANMPEGGWPAILFIHGYIPPAQYSTTGNYPTYQARLARAGFVTFKPDLRGHGDSEGEPVSGNLSEAYVVDTLSALAYLKEYESVNPERIGYWGHSNGGGIGLKTLVVSPDIKAASLWAGMVGSYEAMLETYKDEIPFLQRDFYSNEELVKKGLPSDNTKFWDTIDPYNYLGDIIAPIQLQHGSEDDGQVPVELSRQLNTELKKLNKTVEYFEYEGDNHNISNNVNIAFQRTIDFYNEYLNIMEEKTDMQISIQTGDSSIVFALNDSQAAKDLYAQLPLMLEVEDYGSNEKIFYPPKKLNIKDAPLADAKLGTLAYYAPWGDVVMFYDDFGSAEGLYELGSLVSGGEHIRESSGIINIKK